MKITDHKKLDSINDNSTDSIVFTRDIDYKKLYLDFILSNYKLIKSAGDLFSVIIEIYSHNTYLVDLSGADKRINKSSAVTYKAISDLLNNKMIYRSTKGNNVYYVSPHIAPYTSYGKPKSLTLKSMDDIMEIDVAFNRVYLENFDEINEFYEIIKGKGNIVFEYTDNYTTHVITYYINDGTAYYLNADKYVKNGGELLMKLINKVKQQFNDRGNV